MWYDMQFGIRKPKVHWSSVHHTLTNYSIHLSSTYLNANESVSVSIY
jgi:hypothetical protein